MGVSIASAEKKVRQAEFFLNHLKLASREMVNELARGGGHPERLEYFFSACLSAGQSVYYILEETGGLEFRAVQKKWRDELPDRGLAFGRLIGLRGSDVHLGITGAERKPKYVEQDHRLDHDPHRTVWHHNVALLGADAPMLEEVNPDGEKVTGPILRSTVGLYLDHHGERLEATTICREFIDSLRSLVDATKAAGL